jgi:dihydroorotate dehydrogenase electron transfer subunit
MVRGEWGFDPILPRALSLVQAGQKGAVLIRVVGQGTGLLADMRPGDRLRVLGPMGRGYDIRDASLRPVLVGGGVGIAPIIFLAEQLTAGPHRPVCIYGARTSTDLPLVERLEQVSDVIVTTEDGSGGEKGMVTDPLDRVLSDGTPSEVFACGPEAMLRAVARVAHKTHTRCEVALESPMACGMGTCKGCAFETADGELRYVCSDGPVFDSVEIFGGTQ